MSTRVDLEDLRNDVQWATAGHTRKLDDARATVTPLLPFLGRLTREHLNSLLAGAELEAAKLEAECRDLTEQADEIISARHNDAGRVTACRNAIEQFLAKHLIRHQETTVKQEPFGLWKLAEDIKSFARAAAARLETIDSDLQMLLTRQIGMQFILHRHQSSRSASSYRQMLEALELELAASRSLHASLRANSSLPPGTISEHLQRAEAIADGLGSLLAQECEQQLAPITDLSERLEIARGRLQRLARLCTRYPRSVCRHSVSPWQWLKLKQLQGIIAEITVDQCDDRVQRAHQLFSEIESYCLTSEFRLDQRHLGLIQREITTQLHLARLAAKADALRVSFDQLEYAQAHAESTYDKLLVLSQLITEGQKACADFDFSTAHRVIGAAARSCRSLLAHLHGLLQQEEQLKLDRRLDELAKAEAAARRDIRLANCQRLGSQLMTHADRLGPVEVAEVALLLASITDVDDRDDLLRVEDRLIVIASRIKTENDPQDELDEAYRRLIEAEMAPVGTSS